MSEMAAAEGVGCPVRFEPLEEPRGVAVIEDVPACFKFDFKFGNAERPRAQRLHEAAFKIEEAQQPAGVFIHVEFSAEVTTIARKPVWK